MSGKRILVLGGSGRTGKLVINEALSRGYKVTALVRDPSALETPEPRSDLTLVRGSPTSKDDVASAFAQDRQTPPEAVIVTLNARLTTDSPFSKPATPPRMMADSCANAVQLMKEYGTKKIVIMSAFGVADSFKNLNCTLQLLFRKSNMAYQFEDHNLVDQEVKAAAVDYVLVRPVMLAEGDDKTVKTYGNLGEGVSIFSKITRTSVAKFLVDAAVCDEWDRSTPVISN
ncbi:putative TrkA-N domain dehydrogenase [Glonium stellatum]|uniref:Putative TrkA-N domain dehydrogenase n=1 Tax=Glonium stellatum TaxID=574774 RepID=A0A8E2F5W5_9PEZI|nr:putative TrkA-N domain dehydrogenase [Glonium stellatum]